MPSVRCGEFGQRRGRGQARDAMDTDGTFSRDFVLIEDVSVLSVHGHHTESIFR